jgi:exosortase A-associated hydrolase 2
MTGSMQAPELKTLPRAFYLPSPAGQVATFYFQPEPGVPHRHDILYVHPFGLELPQSRTVMSSLWRFLAAEGVGVFAIDLPGCGDSEGDFADATWDAWLDALRTAWLWLLENSGRPSSICGLRLGAILALELIDRITAKPDKVILLSPVLTGEQMMTQFLRLRVAFSGMRDVPEKRETTKVLRSLIAEGEKLEIAGYVLNPELVRRIDRLSLAAWTPQRANLRIDWLDCGPGGLAGLADSISETWRNAGAAVHHQSVDVKPYWTHTRGAADEYYALARALAAIVESEATVK